MKLDLLRGELVALSLQLDAFADSNQITGTEFSEAGCPERARAKLGLASVERLLASRIRCITEPASHADSTRWELTMEQYIRQLGGTITQAREA
jgi:hypothetical protein